jgi:hypothetical protein
MNYYRQIYAKAPHVLEIPPDLRDQPVEIIILSLDSQADRPSGTERDTLGWPVDFFAATAGQWAGEPLVREQPADYETRLDLP